MVLAYNVSLWCSPWSVGWSRAHGVVIYTNANCLHTIVNLFDGVKGLTDCFDLYS